MKLFSNMMAFFLVCFAVNNLAYGYNGVELVERNNLRNSLHWLKIACGKTELEPNWNKWNSGNHYVQQRVSVADLDLVDSQTENLRYEIDALKPECGTLADYAIDQFSGVSNNAKSFNDQIIACKASGGKSWATGIVDAPTFKFFCAHKVSEN